MLTREKITRIWESKCTDPNNVKQQYEATVDVFCEYSQTGAYYLKDFRLISLFFAGGIFRHHAESVHLAIFSLVNDMFREPAHEDTPTYVLTRVRDALLQDRKEINPEGDLVRCINFIQEQIDLQVINLNDLNEEIRREEHRPAAQ